MDLQSNTIDYVEKVVNFICSMKFKDEITATSLETRESMKESSQYLAAYLKTDNLSDIEREGIIASYVELNPYYNHLWKNYNVTPHVSRLGKDFDILYYDEDMVLESSFLEGYISIYKQCRQYFHSTGYSKSMETLTNYRKFCGLVINFMAYANFMAKWLKNPYDIDLMSEEMIDKFTASFGINYFKKLPLQYKRKIAKNLNKLISSKGTDQVIIDILDLFNFSNIEVFKYFLVRDEIISYEDESGENVISNVTNPRFFSHNIKEKSLANAIKAGTHRVTSIDEGTINDKRWQMTDAEIAALSFDYVQTKYFSTNSGFELYKEGLGTAFLYNLFYKIRKDYSHKERLETISSSISAVPIRIEDLLLTLQVITLDYYDVVDNIQFDVANIYNIYSFTSLDDNALNRKVFGNEAINWTLRDLSKVDTFDINTLLSVYENNYRIHTNMKEKMYRTNSIDEFNNLKKLYNSKFIEKINLTLFNGFETYTSYISTKNKDLYNYIISSRNIEDDQTRKETQEKQITLIIDVLTDYLTGINLYFSSTALDILAGYLKEVIEVFKSFTVTIKDLDVFIIVKDQGNTKTLDIVRKMSKRVEYKNRIPWLYGRFAKMLTTIKEKDRSFLGDDINVKYVYDRPTLVDLTNSRLPDTIQVINPKRLDLVNGTDIARVTDIDRTSIFTDENDIIVGRNQSEPASTPISDLDLSKWTKSYADTLVIPSIIKDIPSLRIKQTRLNSEKDNIYTIVNQLRARTLVPFLITVLYKLDTNESDLVLVRTSTVGGTLSTVIDKNGNIISGTSFKKRYFTKLKNGMYYGVFETAYTASEAATATAGYQIGIGVKSNKLNVLGYIDFAYAHIEEITNTVKYATSLKLANITSKESLVKVNKLDGTTGINIHYSNGSISRYNYPVDSSTMYTLPYADFDYGSKYITHITYNREYDFSTMDTLNYITYSRSTPATMPSLTGGLIEVQENVPRFFNNGLLIDYTVYNYMPYTSNPSMWTKFGTGTDVVKSTTIKNILNDDFAWEIIPNNTASSGVYTTSSTTFSTTSTHVFSIFVHKPTLIASGQTSLLIGNAAFNGTENVKVDFANYTSALPAGFNYGFETYGDWIRYWYSGVPINDIKSPFVIYSGTTTGRKFIVDGAMLEIGYSYPSSYYENKTATNSLRRVDTLDFKEPVLQKCSVYRRYKSYNTTIISHGISDILDGVVPLVKPSTSFQGILYEVIVFEKALTTTEKTAFLASKAHLLN